jgi:hypothetical protein
MTNDRPESICEITSIDDGLQADMNRLLAIVTVDQVLASRNVRGMQRSFDGPCGTFAPRQETLIVPWRDEPSPVTRSVTHRNSRGWKKARIAA